MFIKRYQNALLKGVTGSRLPNCNNPYDRSINTTNVSRSATKYYDALGVSPSATQSDIKAAYYKLSMLYHPDKNKGSETAAQRFRDITEAYEVLGNYRTRKLYDKGIIHTAGPQYGQSEEYYEQPPEDDAQTKFYKAHMKKSKVPQPEGRTPIYNFDEWSRAHYGESFERRKAAKERFDLREERKKRSSFEIKYELLLWLLALCTVGFGSVIYQEYSYDTPKVKRVEKEDGS